MVFFLMQSNHKGHTLTKGAIQDMIRHRSTSSEHKAGVAHLNTTAHALEQKFWIWTLGQLRSQFNFQKSQLCMWTSFFLKSRGLSWLGMESLADQGVVCGRNVINRWMKDQSMRVKEFCR